MSSATRRIRSELATTILAALGLRHDKMSDPADYKHVEEAETALCQRVKEMITQLCNVGITKARIAREIGIDAGALSELSDGWTGRLGLESIWEAYRTLVLFMGRASESLRPNAGPGDLAHAVLLGFSAHPDQAKVTGSEALRTMGHNILAALGEKETMRLFGPQIKGASAVYMKDGHWVLTAHICPDVPQEMTRIARDEIWHFEQWLRRQDTHPAKPKKLKSAF